MRCSPWRRSGRTTRWQRSDPGAEPDELAALFGGDSIQRTIPAPGGADGAGGSRSAGPPAGDVSGPPCTISERQATITAIVTDPSGVESVRLDWRVNNEFGTQPMQLRGADTYGTFVGPFRPGPSSPLRNSWASRSPLVTRPAT